MKLRNKKTGEIWDIGKVLTNDYPSYDTLEQITEDFEDYKPAEPLIKDEKIRKAVRAWVDSLRDVMCDGAITFYVDTAYCTFCTDVWKSNDKRDFDIAELDLVFDYDGLEDSVTYTIDELCGEEEE